MSEVKINPCDFCLIREMGDCVPENRRCSDKKEFHWCNLPDVDCNFNHEPKCMGYDKCPNVKAFYAKKETN